MPTKPTPTQSQAACSYCERYTDDFRRDGWQFYPIPDKHGRTPGTKVLFCTPACAEAWVVADKRT